MNEKDPFAKYDKLFEEQDREHDEQVKEYRNEVIVKENPRFTDIEQDEIRDRQEKANSSNQAAGLIISIVIGVIVIRSIFSSSQTTFSKIFTIFFIIGISSSVYKYFKNKR